MQKKTNILRLAVVAVLSCLSTSLAFSQATRTWVSGVGDDANPCSRTAPCKTFAGAILKTIAGGEIDVLDPGGFGAVTINKSISIEAEGLIAGVLVSGTNGIVVAAGPTDVVVIRGLTFEGLGTGLAGINFISGGSLFVENCKINGFQTGIGVAPTAGLTNVFIDNTTIRDSRADGIQFAPTGSGSVVATVDKVKTENNISAGVEADGNSRVMLENSTSASNTFGLLAEGPKATILLNNVTAFGNGSDQSTAGGGVILPEQLSLFE